jgi:hypothetical protein
VLSFAGLEFAACPRALSHGTAFGVHMVVARLVSSCACFIVCCIVLRAVFSLCGVLEMTTGNGCKGYDDVLSRYMPLMDAVLFLLWSTIVLQSPMHGK